MVTLMKELKIIFLLFLLFDSSIVLAERIKDIANIAGVRENQLIGYGVVVGLNGTGDTSNSSPFTINSIASMLESFGVNVRADITKMKPKNIAAVMVTAELSAFARAGQQIDVTVSSFFWFFLHIYPVCHTCTLTPITWFGDM